MAEHHTNIRQRILDVAKEEFLAHGYSKASMRSIAAKVGVTATALYRHFADKEALFSALVEPVWQGFMDLHADHDRETYEYLIHDHPEQMWDHSGQEFMQFLTYFYDHIDVFKLLLCCASGTRYSQFQHDMVERETKTMSEIIEFMRKRGHSVNSVDPRSLHLLLSGFFTSLLEMIVHDYSRAEAEQHMQVLAVYFTNGMRAILEVKY